MHHAVAPKKRISAADARWLLLATALHALILMIPVEESSPGSVAKPAKFIIRLISDQEAVQPEASPALEKDEIQPKPVVAEPPAVKDAEEPVLRPQPAPAEPLPTPATGPAVTAARLIGLRASVAERIPIEENHGPESLKLGTPRPFERPENWQPWAGAEALAPFKSDFNGKTVPKGVEIVNRWLAADGSHHVIVETPAGLRLCGRARAWDPVQPLVEHVMLFNVCGNDGAVPFEFMPRKPLDRDFIVPVAKETTEP